jgi:membrane protein YdbS with pleckstrin-like domain
VLDIGVDWRPIAPQARLVWAAAAYAVVVPVLGALVVLVGVAAGTPAAAAGAIVAVGVLVLVWVLVDRRYRSWGYCVRDDELILRHGRLIRRLTIVPIGRMQLIDIQQGPLDRRFGVANLQLHTAAAASDARVPMLSVADADRLRDELTSRGAGRGGGT